MKILTMSFLIVLGLGCLGYADDTDMAQVDYKLVDSGTIQVYRNEEQKLTLYSMVLVNDGVTVWTKKDDPIINTVELKNKK